MMSLKTKSHIDLINIYEIFINTLKHIHCHSIFKFIERTFCLLAQYWRNKNDSYTYTHSCDSCFLITFFHLLEVSERSICGFSRRIRNRFGSKSMRLSGQQNATIFYGISRIYKLPLNQTAFNLQININQPEPEYIFSWELITNCLLTKTK